MSFVFIDYSNDLKSKKTSPVISPNRNGKFIQVRRETDEYFVLSPKASSLYHANIAERFLHEKGIQGRYNAKGDLYEIYDPGWEIKGGGLWSIDDQEKTLHLFGSSKSYGKYDRRGLKDRLHSLKHFFDYKIIID